MALPGTLGLDEDAKPLANPFTVDELIEKFSPSTDIWDKARARGDLQELNQESRDHVIERDRRSVRQKAQDFGYPVEQRVYDILGKSPGVSPDTLAGLIDLDEDEYAQTIYDILTLDQQVTAESIASDMSEPGTAAYGNADIPWHERALPNFLKGTVRNALITATLPWELMVGSARSIYGAAREGDWGSAVGSWLGAGLPGLEAALPEGRVGPWEQTTFYQSYIQGKPQGSGWLPSYEEGFAGYAQEEAAIAAATAGNGSVGWTLGRGLTDALGWHPDSLRYRNLSGLIDFGIAMLDPLVLVGKVGKTAKAARYAKRAQEAGRVGVEERAMSTAAKRAQETIEQEIKAAEDELVRIETETGVSRAEAEAEIAARQEELDDAINLYDELDAMDDADAAAFADSMDADRLADAQNRMALLQRERERLLRERDVLIAFADGGPMPVPDITAYTPDNLPPWQKVPEPGSTMDASWLKDHVPPVGTILFRSSTGETGATSGLHWSADTRFDVYEQIARRESSPTDQQLFGYPKPTDRPVEILVARVADDSEFIKPSGDRLMGPEMLDLHEVRYAPGSRIDVIGRMVKQGDEYVFEAAPQTRTAEAGGYFGGAIDEALSARIARGEAARSRGVVQWPEDVPEFSNMQEARRYFDDLSDEEAAAVLSKFGLSDEQVQAAIDSIKDVMFGNTTVVADDAVKEAIQSHIDAVIPLGTKAAPPPVTPVLSQADVDAAIDRLLPYAGFPGIVTKGNDASLPFAVSDAVSIGIENGEIVTVRLPRVYDSMPEVEQAISNRLSARINELQEPDATITIGEQVYYRIPGAGVYSTNMWDANPGTVQAFGGPLPGSIPDATRGTVFVPDELISDMQAHISKAMGPDPNNPIQYTADEWKEIIRRLPRYEQGDNWDQALWDQIVSDWAQELTDMGAPPMSPDEVVEFFKDTARFDEAWIGAGGRVDMVDLTDDALGLMPDVPQSGGHLIYFDEASGVPKDLPVNAVGPHAQIIMDPNGRVVAAATLSTDRGVALTFAPDGSVVLRQASERGAAGTRFDNVSLLTEAEHQALVQRGLIDDVPVIEESVQRNVATSKAADQMMGKHAYAWNVDTETANYVGKIEGAGDVVEWDVNPNLYRVEAFDAVGNRLTFAAGDEFADVSHARMVELVENATEATRPGFRAAGVDVPTMPTRIAEWRVTRMDETGKPVAGATEVMPAREVLDDAFADISRHVDEVMDTPEALITDRPASIRRTVPADEPVDADMLDDLVGTLFRTSLELDNTAKNALDGLRRMARRDAGLTWDTIIEVLAPYDQYMLLLREWMLANNILSVSGVGPNKVNWVLSKLTGSSTRVPGDGTVPIPPMTKAGRQAQDAIDEDLGRIAADLTDAERTVSAVEGARAQARAYAQTVREARVKKRMTGTKIENIRDEIEGIKRGIEEGDALTARQKEALAILLKRLAIAEDAGVRPRLYSVEDTVALLAQPSWLGTTGRRAADRLFGRLGAEGIIPTLVKERNPARINEWFQGNLPPNIVIEMAETQNAEAMASLVREIMGGRLNLFDSMANTSRAYFLEHGPRMPLTPMAVKALEKSGQTERVGRQVAERAQESVWVDVRNRSKGAYSLGIYLKTIGLSSERSDKLVAKFIRAEKDEEALEALMYSVMDGVRDSILDEAGLALDSEFGKAIDEATRLFPGGNLRSWRKYYQDRIGQGAVPPTVVVDGQSYQFMSPHLEIELLDTGAMLPSTSKLRALNTKWGRLGYKAENGQLQENAVGIAKRWASQFTEMWRSLQLVRMAYVLRNIGETQYRAYLHGHHNMFTDPLMWTAMAMSTAGGRTGKVGRALTKRFERYQNLAPGVTADDLFKVRTGKELDDWIDEQGGLLDAMVEEYVSEIVGMASPNDYRPLSMAAHGFTKEWVSRADGEKFRLAHARQLLMLSMDPLTRVVADPLTALKNYGKGVDEAAYRAMDPEDIKDAVVRMVMDQDGPYYATLEKRYNVAHKRERQGWFDPGFLRWYLFDWEDSVANRIQMTTGGDQRLRDFLSDPTRTLVSPNGEATIQLDARSALRRAALKQGGPVRTRERNAAFEDLDRDLANFISGNNMAGNLADDAVFLYMNPVDQGTAARKFGDAFFSWAGETEKIAGWSPEWRTAMVREGLRNLDMMHPEDALEWLDYVGKTLPKVKRGSNPIVPGSYWDIKNPLKKERQRQQARLAAMDESMKGKNRRIWADTQTEAPTLFITSDNAEAARNAVKYGRFAHEGDRVRVVDVDVNTGEMSERWVRAHVDPQEGFVGIIKEGPATSMQEIAQRKLKQREVTVTSQMTSDDINFWTIKDRMQGFLTVDEVKRISAQAATQHVKELFYHASSTSNWSHAWRMLFPFVSPQMNGYRSFAKSTMDWTRLATRHYPALRLFTSAQKEGSSVLNETLDLIEPGTTPIYDNNTDGDTPNRPFLWKDAQGNLRARVPLAGSALAGITDAFQITEDARNQELGVALNSLNLFFQGSQAIPEGRTFTEQAAYTVTNAIPGAGPMLQTGLAAVPFVRESYTPVGRVLNRWVWPYGRPSDASDLAMGVLPAWGRYAVAGLFPFGQVTEEYRARDERGLLTYHTSRHTGISWASDPAAQQDLTQRVRRDAIALTLLRAIAGFIGPAVPRWEHSVEDLDDDMLVQAYVAEEFQQIRDMAPDYDTAVVTFMDRFGENLAPILVPSTAGTMSVPSLQAFDQLIRNEELMPYREVINYFYPGERDWVPYEWALRKEYRKTLSLEERMREAARFVADAQKTQIDRASILSGYSDERKEFEDRQWAERWEGVPGATGNQQFLSLDERLGIVRRALDAVPDLRQSPAGSLALEAFERMDYWEAQTEDSLSAKSSDRERALFHQELQAIFGDEPQAQEMRRLFIRATS